MQVPTTSTYLSTAVAVIVITLLSVAAVEAQNLEDRPNLGGIEFLGRGLLYSANYERYVNRVGFGAGFASWRIDHKTIAVLPVYVSFRPIGNTHSLYLSAGATVGSQVKTLFNKPTFACATAAVGYEHLSKSGLVIRPTMNLLFNGEALLWPGLMVGYRF